MSWLDLPEPAWCSEHDERADECMCAMYAQSQRDDQDEQWAIERLRGEQ